MKAMACLARGEGSASVSAEEMVRIVNEKPEALVWIDFDRPLAAEDRRMLMAPPFNFHELALEDASRPDGQRPKVDPYDDHLFMVMHAVTVRSGPRWIELDWHEIDLFVGRNYVISVHRDERPELAQIWKDAESRPGIMGYGPDRLTYHILDAVVDRYIEVVDDVEDVLDELEDAVIDPSADEKSVQEIFRFKRQLVGFRKKGIPLREAVNEMTSRAYPFVGEETSFYLRDVYDHLMRISDMLDTYRDILTGALDVHLSAVSNRLNDIMKRLTIVATIFMPLTFLTGFWGMNFVDLPFGSGIWFWGSMLVMGAMAAIMILLFQTRKYR